MVHRADQLRVKCLLTEAITLLCKSGLNYSSQLNVEGLLGITLDHGDIFLVNINETIHSDLSAPQQVAAQSFSGSKAAVGEAFNEGVIETQTSAAAPEVAAELVVIDDGEEAGLTERSRLSDDVELNQTEDIDERVQLSEEAVLQDEVGGLEDELEEDGDDLREDLGEGTSMDCEFNDALFGGKSRKLGLMEGELGTAVFNSDDIASLLGKVAPDDDDVVQVKVERHGRTFAPAVDRVVDTAEDGMLTSWTLDDQQDAMPLNLADDMHTDLSMEHDRSKSTGELSCVKCGKAYRSKQGLKKHKCLPPQTGRPTETSQPLDLTVVRADGATAGGAAYTCESCARSFADYASCVTHTCAACHVCDLCGARLRSHSGYAKHRRRHAGTYQFHCTLCHKGFFDRTNLRAHMDATHSKVRRHSCPTCQKSFFWKHHLKRHVVHCGTSLVEPDEMADT